MLGCCREAKQQIALPRPQLAGRKGQAVQLLLQKSDVQLMQVRLCVEGCRTQHMPIATTMQQAAALMLIMFGRQHVPGWLRRWMWVLKRLFVRTCMWL
jgi:hypothetical protein